MDIPSSDKKYLPADDVNRFKHRHRTVQMRPPRRHIENCMVDGDWQITGKKVYDQTLGICTSCGAALERFVLNPLYRTTPQIGA